MDRQEHWNTVYTTKSDSDVSWTELEPTLSLQMLAAAGLSASSCVIDIGGGNSRLVECLLDRGLTCLAVLDVSAAALARTRERLGTRGNVPVWIEADVTADWSAGPMDVWHDRAVFHFLTDVRDRARYRAHMAETLKPGGSAIIATFASDGPLKCSGLPVERYSPESLADEMGPALQLVDSVHHVHRTPMGTSQSFQYSRFVRLR